MGDIVTYQAIKSLQHQSRTLSNKTIFKPPITIARLYKPHYLPFLSAKAASFKRSGNRLGDHGDMLEIPYRLEQGIHSKAGGCMSAS